MKYVGRLRKKLITAIKHVCSERNTCFVSPKRDFTRSSKISPQDIFKCLLTMESSSLSHELLNYFDYSTNIPTKSAFVQAAQKSDLKLLALCLTNLMLFLLKLSFLRVSDFLHMTVQIYIFRQIRAMLIRLFLERLVLSHITCCISMPCMIFYPILTLMLLYRKSTVLMNTALFSPWHSAIL